MINAAANDSRDPVDQKDKYRDLDPNRSNDGNSGSPATDPEIEPGKIPAIDPDDHPTIKPEIEPEIEPGKIPQQEPLPKHQ